jgi:hypothetical protein
MRANGAGPVCVACTIMKEQAARVAELRQQADQSLAPPFNPSTNDDPNAVRYVAIGLTLV